MTLTRLDPVTALIVIDLQKGGLSLPAAPYSLEDVAARAGALANAFRRHGLPVVLVNVAGAAPGRTEFVRKTAPARPHGWTEFVPELNQQPGDHVVTKRTWGAFKNTDLEDYLQGRGATQVVVAGCATSIGVDSTARQAYESGFNVTIAVDAMTDVSADAHFNCVSRIFPRLSETGEARQIVDLLDKTHP